MRVLETADPDELSRLCRSGEFFWLDLHDPELETIDALGESLGLHELAVEDTREFGQRPKVESYGDELLVVYFGARLDDDRVPVPVEVHLHVSGSFVVTVHRDDCRHFDLVREVLERDPPNSEEIVVYRVLDALTDSVLDVLEHIAADVEVFEAEVVRRPRARDRDRMALLRRSLTGLRRTLVTQRQVFPRLTDRITELPRLGHDVQAYYRDVADHLARAVDEIEDTRDSLQGLLDTYTNEVQERLTIVATIFLPLTVITSFFGQNFNWLINHIGSAWAFWGLGIGGLVVSCVAIVTWLLRTGLLQGGRR